MYLQNDLLMGAAEELRHALAENAAARGREWAIRVGHALSDVEKILRQHAGEIPTGDETLIGQERALLPSPGIERKADALREELQDLIDNVRMLRTELAAGRESSANSTQKAHTLLHRLDKLERAEVELVQQSITPDIGAGD
jgi:predicted  nucleic acid-binding Zn-ribbon protein